MKHCTITCTSLFIALLFTAPGVGPVTASAADFGPEPRYIFAYFKDGERFYRQDHKFFTGGGGVHLAGSPDGLVWTKLQGGRLVFKTRLAKVLRDPSIARGPDGDYHLVFTTGWREHTIGYAHSRDLLTWDHERLIPVMAHEPEALNCWAPEVIYDDASRNFLIYWSTTIPGRFPETQTSGDDDYNHRIYFTTTTDFETFTPTALLYDPGFNCIDAFIAPDGPEYLMFLKNETRHPPAKNLVLARAPAAAGPYGSASPPFSPAGEWVEGPSAILIAGSWFVYFDMYSTRRFGLLVSDDLMTWQDRSADLQMPGRAKHGSIFEVGPDVMAGLLD